MTTMNATFISALALLLITFPAGAPLAQTDARSDAIGAASTATPPTPMPETLPRYSLPWQLRPVTTGNTLRIDGGVAVFNDANGNFDVAATTFFNASYQITRDWAPMIRLGFVGNNAPGAALDGSSLVNPLIGATYTRRLGRYRLALFGATTLPLGTGGGNAPSVGTAKTNAASFTARPADDAMFAVNYMTAIAGIDFAYVNRGFTAQGEATVQQYVRVRGGKSAGATDPFRTNAAVGLHLGYFIGAHFSLSSDLRYQRWISDPTTLDVLTGAHLQTPGAQMDSFTVAVGPRTHFRFGNQTWIRPGLSFVRGFDSRGFGAPLLTKQTTAVQIDIPVMF